MNASNKILSLICLMIVSLFGNAQTFRLNVQEQYGSILDDSMAVVDALDELRLDSLQKSQIAKLIGDNPGGKFQQFTLINTHSEAGALYLRFCRLAEDLQIFRVIGDSLAHTPLGNGMLRKQSTIPSSHNYYRLDLSSKDSSTFIVYLKFPESNPNPHYQELALFEAKRVTTQYFEKAALQNLYAGFILLTVGLSLLSAWMLKYRPLFFFGLHMFFWIPYFQIQHNLFGFWNLVLPQFNFLQHSTLNIGLLLVFAHFFALDFLKLKERMGKWFYGYTAINALTLVLALLALKWTLNQWLNYALVLVILQHLVITVYLSVKGIKSAKQLLLSIGFLLLGALAMILTQIGVFPISWITAYLFQLGTLLFSLILFYSLAARVSEIRLERKEAAHLIQIKSQFFQDISHELRSPLSLVIDPIRKVHEALPDGENKEALQIAKNASEGLQSLVNQILDLSRLEFSPPPLLLKSLDLNSFLRTQCSQYSSLAESRQIQLEYAGPSGEVWCAFDPDKMQQIISNLLSNALKFTPAGGEVMLRLKNAAKEVEISLADTGAGISRKAIEHVFERFYQDPEAPPTAQPGTGIGLALCKALVEQHHGSIKVESEQGKGSTFSMVLPKNLSPSAERQTEEINLEEIPLEGAKPLVLVAEDHPDLRTYLHQCLKGSYDVLLAKNGLEAWEIALDRQPDLIVSDLMMPNLTGIELTQKIKSHKETCHIPIFLLTAKSEQEAVNEGLAAGADDYLAKPFNSEELLLRLQNILRQMETWRQKVAEMALPKVAENTLNKVDRNFLEQLENSLAQEYSNTEFGVEDLAALIGMSKTHLNRKLNVLLGSSASKLIQNYRLEQARNMLLEKQGNVSEIAFACGFNSPAYFVKCFKDKYQETPGQLL